MIKIEDLNLDSIKKVADEDLSADMLFTALNNEIAVLKKRIAVLENKAQQ